LGNLNKKLLKPPRQDSKQKIKEAMHQKMTQAYAFLMRKPRKLAANEGGKTWCVNNGTTK
jgi:hypothetical protein